MKNDLNCNTPSGAYCRSWARRAAWPALCLALWLALLLYATACALLVGLCILADVLFPRRIGIEGMITGYTYTAQGGGGYRVTIGDGNGLIIGNNFHIEGFTPADLGRRVRGTIMRPRLFPFDKAGADASFLIGDEGQPGQRPARWSQPLELAGVPNLHRVNAHIYRSAQPTAEGMHNLYAFGIRTIVSLRAYHSDSNEIGALPLKQEHIRIKTWSPRMADVVRFLRIVNDPQNAPVLVHCHHGADRTGTLCAIYHIVCDGWSKEEAVREMTIGGYGYHSIWSHLPRFVQKIDAEALRREMTSGATGNEGGE